MYLNNSSVKVIKLEINNNFSFFTFTFFNFKL